MRNSKGQYCSPKKRILPLMDLVMYKDCEFEHFEDEEMVVEDMYHKVQEMVDFLNSLLEEKEKRERFIKDFEKMTSNQMDQFNWCGEIEERVERLEEKEKDQFTDTSKMVTHPIGDISGTYKVTNASTEPVKEKQRGGGGAGPVPPKQSLADEFEVTHDRVVEKCKINHDLQKSINKDWVFCPVCGEKL